MLSIFEPKLYLFYIKSIYFSNLACRKIKVGDTQKTFLFSTQSICWEEKVILLWKRRAQINSGIWTEIVHNLRGLLDRGNTQQAKSKWLEFHAIWDIGIFYRWLFGKVEWLYSTPRYLFKAIVRIYRKGDMRFILYI